MSHFLGCSGRLGPRRDDRLEVNFVVGSSVSWSSTALNGCMSIDLAEYIIQNISLLVYVVGSGRPLVCCGDTTVAKVRAESKSTVLRKFSSFVRGIS